MINLCWNQDRLHSLSFQIFGKSYMYAWKKTGQLKAYWTFKRDIRLREKQDNKNTPNFWKSILKQLEYTIATLPQWYTVIETLFLAIILVLQLIYALIAFQSLLILFQSSPNGLMSKDFLNSTKKIMVFSLEVDFFLWKNLV